MRLQMERSFPMVATASAIAARPGLAEQSLGQNAFLHHWLRLTPRLQLRDKVEIIGQIDVVTGMLAGARARDVDADHTPRNDWNGFSNVQPRWLYAQAKLPFGLVRAGQQPNHWGMGILANDGDHPLVFGDYRYGSIVERLLFATRPGGPDSNFVLALAGDLVFRDNTARLTRGDRAVQGALAAFWAKNEDTFGLFSTLRHQARERVAASYSPYADEIDALAIDLHGRIVRPLPGDGDTFVLAEAEAAYILGETNVVRTPEQVRSGTSTAIRSWGGAASLGIVHRAPGDTRPRAISYGDLSAQVELGYASGDADPRDGTERRFVFDPNHRVGLLLFDELLRFQTARAATAASDPLLVNGARPPPGADLLPTNGGVAGAQYLNPTVVYRPRHWLDLRGGMVVAQTTSDLVDPYRLATEGSYVNGRGGNPRKRDLGLELDGGVEARLPLEYGVVANLGAQAGVLFPGGAFEDETGARLPVQWVAIGRAGLTF
jgi:hypothetical protein